HESREAATQPDPRSMMVRATRLAAIQRAAHAVIGVVNGFQVQEFAIDTEPADRMLKGVENMLEYDAGEPTETQRNRALKYIEAIAAGIHSVETILFYPKGTSGVDYSTIQSISAIENIFFGRDVMDQVFETTKALLDANWHAIESVSELLEDGQTLNGERVAQIVKRPRLRILAENPVLARQIQRVIEELPAEVVEWVAVNCYLYGFDEPENTAGEDGMLRGHYEITDIEPESPRRGCYGISYSGGVGAFYGHWFIEKLALGYNGWRPRDGCLVSDEDARLAHECAAAWSLYERSPERRAAE
ncbi:MAG: hypothetical protein AB7F99_18750, partial [Vicinamibacterales bacterium]